MTGEKAVSNEMAFFFFERTMLWMIFTIALILSLIVIVILWCHLDKASEKLDQDCTDEGGDDDCSAS